MLPFKNKSYRARDAIQVLVVLMVGYGVIACNGSSGTSTPSVPLAPTAPVDPGVQPIIPPSAAPVSGQFIVESETMLSADGPNTGLSAYALIEAKFAPGSIESPDLYSTDHASVVHIIEDEDPIIGPHFVFLAHRDIDYDRGVMSDRQRNEIKTFDQSDDSLLAFKGDTMQYSWQFKVSSDLALSSRFTHFFQIKARNYSPELQDNVNGNDNQPVITLTGAQRSNTGNMLQVRYSKGNNLDGSRDSDTMLAEIDWFSITDEWLSIFVQTTFDEADSAGAFQMTVVRMSDNQTMLDITLPNIDMWRGQLASDFSRPKWGIYRSLADPQSLRADEERVKFANFLIKKGRLSD